MAKKKPKKKLILTVGLPKAGKSTWAMKQGWPVVNPDSIRLAIHGQKFFGPAEPLIWAVAYTMADALFKAGHDTVIIDATHVSNRRRVPWSERFRDTAEVSLEIFRVSPEECIERAKAEGDTDIIPVIRRMAREWDLARFWEVEGDKSDISC